MADETASLIIRVDSQGANTASRQLNKLDRSAVGAERATDGLTRSFTRLLGPITAAVSAVAGFNKLVSVTREFNKLNAGLITATGSAENAAVAFEAIQQFASETPYDLQQVTEGFTKLVNLGLTPSEKALTSYGNTAAAMGKDLNQLIEAVADAATGEFERLKEFGIRAKSEGDRVSFTFRGITTTVGKNAAEIEQYLIDLGENNFADAMVNRMDTLDGALSNLGDEWDKLFLNISEQGVGDLIEDGVRLAIDALQELNAQLASGQLTATLDAIASKFAPFGEDAARAIQFIGEVFDSEFQLIQDQGEGAIDFLIDAFRNFPENVRAFVQIMVVEVLAAFDKATAYAVSFKDGIKAIFTDDTFTDVGRRLEEQLELVNSVRMDSISGILEERDSAIQSFDQQIEKAKQLRKEYELTQANRPTGDRLARFAANDPRGGDGSGSNRATFNFDKFERGVLGGFGQDDQSFDAREKEIEEQYQKRREKILEETKLTEEQRTELELELARRRNEQLNELDAERRQTINDGYIGLLDVMKSFYSGMEGEEAAYARAAITIGQTLLDEKKRDSLQSIIASTQSAAMGAYEALASIPYVGPFLGAAAAGGIYVAGGLAAAKVSGLYDNGGFIPAGKVGIVGEYGPEFVSGPANVTSRKETAAMARQAVSGGGRNVTVNQTINVSGRPDNRTSTQIARDSQRKQQLAQRRLGQ